MPRKNKEESEDSEEQLSEDSEKEQEKKELNRPKIDRILKDGVNLKKIIINVSLTQYPVVTEVAEQLKWKIQTDPEAGDWDIFWTDYSIDPDILIRMHFHQKINHYPGIYTIARKNLLGLNLMSMRNHFEQQYDFFPLTWMLPSQYSQFRSYYESVGSGKVRTYIVKPEAECQGRGIFLTRNIEDLENGHHYVIQKYVNKPYLIDGLKFDLRIYVLLCGTDPMRIYLFQQGLARFATESYVEPNSNNLDQMYVHLTNYAINKLNPKFVFNKSANDMSTGHKRSLTSVYKLLEKKGEDVATLKQKIKEIIVKTFITSMPLMSRQYAYSQPEEYSGNMCFHILGFDVLITQDFEPLLLQVNHTPSFTTDTPLDQYIKHKLIKDTLLLMNINTQTKTKLFAKAKEYGKERLHTGKRQIFHGQIRDTEIQKAQVIRNQYEDAHLGGFERIHPVTDPALQKRYETLLEFATKNYSEQNTLRARMEEKEAKKMFKEERKLFNQNNTTKKAQLVSTTELGQQKVKKAFKEVADKQLGEGQEHENRVAAGSLIARRSYSRIQSKFDGTVAPKAAAAAINTNDSRVKISKLHPNAGRLLKKQSKKISDQRRSAEPYDRNNQVHSEIVECMGYNASSVSNGSETPTPPAADARLVAHQEIKIPHNFISKDKFLASRVRIRKASSNCIELPYLPYDDNIGLSCRPGVLATASLDYAPKDNNRKSKNSSSISHHKAAISSFKKGLAASEVSKSCQDKKSRNTLSRKPPNFIMGNSQEQLRSYGTYAKNGMKTGNFLMPKIFDLNAYLREEERHQTLKPSDISKASRGIVPGRQ